MSDRANTDWADSEDHDFLNGFVGMTVHDIATGNAHDDWLTITFSRLDRSGEHRELTIRGVWCNDSSGGLTVEEP